MTENSWFGSHCRTLNNSNSSGSCCGDYHPSIREKIPFASHVARPWQPNGHLKSPNVTASSISTIPPILSFQTLFLFPHFYNPLLSLQLRFSPLRFPFATPASSLLLLLSLKSLRFQSVSGSSPLISLYCTGF